MPSDAAPDCAAHPVHPAPLNKKQSPPDLLCKHGPSFMSSVAERSIENELGTTKVSLPVAEISEPPHTLCAMQPDVVETLAGSIQRLGLHTPITVRPIGRTADLFDSRMYQVITGRYRLAAARKLGWTRIDAVILDCDKTEVRLWEIAENLHRAELTALERDLHIAEWIKLTETKQKEERGVSRQVDAKPRPGRPEGGRSAASRELAVSEADARRAERVAKLSEEAQQVARDTGLDDDRTALLSASWQASGEAQAASLRRQAQEKQEREEARQRRRQAERDPVPTPSPEVTPHDPEPVHEDVAEAEPESAAGEPDAQAREARLFATLIAERIEQEEIAKLTHWIRTVPARYLITALREVT